MTMTNTIIMTTLKVIFLTLSMFFFFSWTRVTCFEFNSFSYSAVWLYLWSFWLSHHKLHRSHAMHHRLSDVIICSEPHSHVPYTRSADGFRNIFYLQFLLPCDSKVLQREVIRSNCHCSFGRKFRCPFYRPFASSSFGLVWLERYLQNNGGIFYCCLYPGADL